MLVVTDINDIFLPLPDDMLVNLAESRAVIETLLNKLPNMFPPTQNVETATGTALKAAFEIVVSIIRHTSWLLSLLLLLLFVLSLYINYIVYIYMHM